MILDPRTPSGRLAIQAAFAGARTARAIARKDTLAARSNARTAARLARDAQDAQHDELVNMALRHARESIAHATGPDQGCSIETIASLAGIHARIAASIAASIIGD